MVDTPKLALVAPVSTKAPPTADAEYEELEEGLEDDEGVFSDGRSVFADDEDPPIGDGVDDIDDEGEDTDHGLPRQRRENHGNPQTTRAREIMPEQLPPAGQPAPVVQLVAVFDQGGQARVARTVNGNRVEEFRPPTQDEWEALKQRGRLVQGGLAAPAPATEEKRSPWMIAAIAAVVVGGGYYLYKKYATEETELDEDAEEV